MSAKKQLRRAFWHLRHGGIKALKEFSSTARAREIGTASPRRSQSPQLSVVIPAYNAGDFIERCIRSIQAQQGIELEIIVVDDGSGDDTLNRVHKMAARDARITSIQRTNSGPADARNVGVDAARGAFIGFVDADDEVLPDGYVAMVRSLESTGSDVVIGGYVRLGATGKSRPKLVERVHREHLESVTLEERPELLEEPVLWNKVYRREFWDKHVAPMPTYANYEDQVPVYRALLSARSIDVLSQDVYAWRLAEGRATRSKRKGRRADLRARLKVIAELESHVIDAVDTIRSRAYATWMGTDLAMHAEFVPTAEKRFRKDLASAAGALKSRMPVESWTLIPAQSRLLMWVTAAGSRKDIEEILGTRAEDTSCVPIEFAGEDRTIAPTYIPRLNTDLPPWLLRAYDADFLPQASIREVHWRDHRVLELKGCAYIPGVDPERISVEILAEYDGQVLAQATLTRRDDERIDLAAGDPWRSYARSGFIAQVEFSAPEIFRHPYVDLVARFELDGKEVRCMLRSVAMLGMCEPSPVVDACRLSALSDEHARLSVRPAKLPVGATLVEGIEFRGNQIDIDLIGRSELAALHLVQGKQEVQLTKVSIAKPNNGNELARKFSVTLPELPARYSAGGELVWKLEATLNDRSRVPAYFREFSYYQSGTGRVRVEPHPAGRVLFSQRALRVSITDAGTDRDRLMLIGRADPPEQVDVFLRSSEHTIAPWEVSRHADGSFTAVFRLTGTGHEGSTVALMKGGYHVRYGVSHNSADGWARAAGSLATRSVDSFSKWNTLTVEARNSGAVAVMASPPWAKSERSRFAQHRLRERDWGPVTEGIVFETYNGKSTVDSPRALFEELKIIQPDTLLYWSIQNRTVEVPDGGIPVVEGTAAWHRALATSRVWVNNNNFPYYVRKRPGQFYLQTWHGTPIKKLLWDMPRRKSPLTYRRLMKTEVQQWDLLLAQTDEAATHLRTGLGFDGPIKIMEYPRNSLLLAGLADPCPIRRRLGIGADETVILYVPTWRNTHRSGTVIDWSDHFDPELLAESLDARILVRSHHVADSRPLVGERVIDVSEEPHVENLMAITNVLVTDYSSIMFDFKTTGRPVVQFVPDLLSYRKERGMYACRPRDHQFELCRDDAQLYKCLRDALEISKQAGISEQFKDTVNSMHELVQWILNRNTVTYSNADKTAKAKR